MKNRKRSLALFLALVLTIVMIFPLVGVNAAAPDQFFTALGDSTGFGLSAYTGNYGDLGDITGGILNINGFNDQFATSLGLTKNANYFNLAWPGDRTSELLGKLGTPTFKALVSQSTIMTVTIGGNNLLGPTINSICALWGVEPVPGDLNGASMLAQLALAVISKYQLDPEYDISAEFMRLMNPTDPVAQQFHASLIAGVVDFVEEWPQIAGQIRSLNQSAELYVNTVHNPLRVSGELDPLYPLYLEFETLLRKINLTIKSYAKQYCYKVVDINQAFKDDPASLSFDILGAMATATALATIPNNPNIPALTLTFLQQTDPHPTMIGHNIAFQQLTKMRRITPPQFWHRY